MFGLGWVGKFGSVGAVGSANGPAAQGDIVQWLQGGTTDRLTLIDKKNVLTEPEIVDVPCLSFDGVDDVLKCGKYSYIQPFEALVSFKSSGTTGYIVSQRDSNLDTSSEFLLVMIAGKLRCAVGNNEVGAAATVASYNDGDWHDVIISFNGTSGSFTVDGGDSTAIKVGANISSFGTVVAARHNDTDSSYTTYLQMFVHHVEFSFDDGSGFAYTMEESLGTTAYDVSGNGNHGTINGATWTTADGIPSWNRWKGFTRVSGLYSVTEPNGGFDRIYDPTTASLGEGFDVLATLAYDLIGTTVGTWTVTNPSATFTFNPNTATIGNFLDALSAITNEVESLPVATVYTITEPSGGRVRSFNPDTDSSSVAFDFLATLLLDIQEDQLIGV